MTSIFGQPGNMSAEILFLSRTKCASTLYHASLQIKNKTARIRESSKYSDCLLKSMEQQEHKKNSNKIKEIRTFKKKLRFFCEIIPNILNTK